MTCQRCKNPYCRCTCDDRTQDWVSRQLEPETLAHVKVQNTRRRWARKVSKPETHSDKAD